MEVKAGYKLTEVGVIPEDWEVKTLGSVSSSISSGKSKTQSDFNGTFPIYGSTGVIGYSSHADYSGRKVLVARVGANAGTVNQTDEKYCVSDNTLMIQLKKDIDFLFMVFFLKHFNVNRLVFGSGQPLITGTQLRNIIFPFPKIQTEQTAIAKVLSDTDALIQSLEKGITKKQSIKQGTMQLLLTGKKRMPGFNGDWEVKKLGEIAYLATGNTPPTNDRSNYGDEFLFVSPADLGKSKYILNTEKNFRKKDFKLQGDSPQKVFCLLVLVLL